MSYPVEQREGEQGFLLLALVVVVFILALFLTIAAPTMARSLERDKEVESEHRAQQYVRAIHNYYMKFNNYPNSMEQLLSQNNQHFLRQQYKDPLTGGDYKLIHVGEAQTTVKGFFGEPLDGIAQGSLGANAGSASGIGSGLGGATSGTGASSSGFSLGQSSFSSGSTGTSGIGTGSSGTSGSSSGTLGGTSATTFQGSKGMIVGVGSNASGHGLVEWNGSANIEDWEFLYDHRTWLQRQKVSIFGGSMGQGGTGGGFASGSSSSTGSSFGSGSTTSGSTFGSGTGSTTNGSSTGTGTTPSSSSGYSTSSSTQPQ